jgi:hypothetical protein
VLDFKPPITLQTDKVNSKVNGKIPVFVKGADKNSAVSIAKNSFRFPKKYLIIFASVVILSLIGGLTIWLFGKREKIVLPKSALIQKKAEIAPPKEIDLTASWKEFKDERLGIYFKYPQNVSLRKDNKTIILEKKFSKLLTVEETFESLSQFLSRYIVKNGKLDNSQVIPEMTEIGGKSAESVTVKTDDGSLLTCEYVEVDRLDYKICIYSGLTEEVKQILVTVKFL